MHFNINIHNVGNISWSCLIAIYRVLYLKAQTWVKFQIGENRLLLLFIILGLSVTLSFGFLLVVIDEESITLKFCNHHDYTYLDILNYHKVCSFTITQNYNPHKKLEIEEALVSFWDLDLSYQDDYF
jgi:hypothetical protein